MVSTPPVVQTDSPPADYIRFGLLLEGGKGKADAVAEVWPGIKSKAAKASRVCSDPRFQVWQAARREANSGRVRQITAALGCDYESRITALAIGFNNPTVKFRERIQIHNILNTEEGRKAEPSTRATSAPTIYAVAFGTGTTGDMGQSDTGRRLSDLRASLSVDTNEGRWPPAVDAVAAPVTDVAGPARPAKARRVPVATVPEV